MPAGARPAGRLQDKVAIITGAGQGIGLAYAERFLDEGAKVVIAEANEERGRIGEASLQGRGEAVFVRTDIADEDSVHASLDYLRRVFDVNLHGQWLMARAVAPVMVAQGYGRIVNQGSIAAYLHQLSTGGDEFTGVPNYAYAQSKWGVIGLTKHLAATLGKHGITVNCIAPGLTMTEATKTVVPEAVQPMFVTMSSMRRELAAVDMTGPAVFFASDDAGLVTGQTLCVDAGTVMPH
jgi:NAD(P)-dependent dehydrogenase (short-subunit alcohol dehydrogenase family)